MCAYAQQSYAFGRISLCMFVNDCSKISSDGTSRFYYSLSCSSTGYVYFSVLVLRQLRLFLNTCMQWHFRLSLSETIIRSMFSAEQQQLQCSILLHMQYYENACSLCTGYVFFWTLVAGTLSIHLVLLNTPAQYKHTHTAQYSIQFNSIQLYSVHTNIQSVKWYCLQILQMVYL